MRYCLRFRYGRLSAFANEIILDGELERPGPEGSEETNDKNDVLIEPKEETKPRYTLLELEEVLNEKNKYKGHFFFSEIATN